jgi:hypothetical protein
VAWSEGKLFVEDTYEVHLAYACCAQYEGAHGVELEMKDVVARGAGTQGDCAFKSRIRYQICLQNSCPFRCRYYSHIVHLACVEARSLRRDGNAVVVRTKGPCRIVAVIATKKATRQPHVI